MELHRLEELKRKLLHDKDLGPVWTFFLDHFAENADFMALGKRAEHPLVETVLAQIAQQLFPGDAEVNRVILTWIDAQQFLHGGYFIGSRIGGVIYFEEEHIGLAAVADN